jgi:redox-sensitive bicupin YhaK (pirin superfamily)
MNPSFSQNQQNEMSSAIDLIIESKTRELVDGFKIRRVLPSAKRRMVGPFIFLDQMRPEILTAGKGLDVAVHPHIGLATVTYLFRGEMLHRDSLGTRQMIRPGEVNWMTAGSGITHSERTPEDVRSLNSNSELFGIQVWVALPKQSEETAPLFAHYGSHELPLIRGEGKRVRTIAGSLYGEKSPVVTSSDLFYADVFLEKGAKFPVSAEYEERAIYIVEGEVQFTTETGVYVAGQLLILKPNEEITLTAATKTAHLLLLGGAPIGEKRFIWWNFVSSSEERIEQAKADWKAGKFAPVPDEIERIPLPADSRPVVVRYP